MCSRYPQVLADNASQAEGRPEDDSDTNHARTAAEGKKQSWGAKLLNFRWWATGFGICEAAYGRAEDTYGSEARLQAVCMP